MKKILIVLAIIMGIIVINVDSKESYYILPKDAIRLRIIPNSNVPYDQFIKIKVRDNIEKELENTIDDNSTIETTRNVIKENLVNYEQIVNNTLEEYKYDQEFNIKYGYNYFPEKEYKGVKYEEGMYESLLITLGNGAGDNWWCVLFPPLCSLEVEENNKNTVEYHLLVKDIVDKYIKYLSSGKIL